MLVWFLRILIVIFSYFDLKNAFLYFGSCVYRTPEVFYIDFKTSVLSPGHGDHTMILRI